MDGKRTCWMVCDEGTDELSNAWFEPVAIYTEKWRADLLAKQTGSTVLECELHEGDGAVRDE